MLEGHVITGMAEPYLQVQVLEKSEEGKDEASTCHGNELSSHKVPKQDPTLSFWRD